MEIALLLQIVDNPRQDIPLAGVLRSPVVIEPPGGGAGEGAAVQQRDVHDALVAASSRGSTRNNPPDLFREAALLAGQDAGTGDTAGETAAASELTPSSGDESVQEYMAVGTRCFGGAAGYSAYATT